MFLVNQEQPSKCRQHEPSTDAPVEYTLANKQRDRKILIDAEKQLKPKTVGGIISVQEYKRIQCQRDEFVEPPGLKDMHDMIRPYVNEWNCRLDIIEEEYLHAGKKGSQPALTLLSDLMNDIRTTMRMLNLHLFGYFPATMVRAYYHVAIIKYRMKDHVGTVEAATEFFKLARCLAKQGKEGRMDRPSAAEATLLYTRARCLERLDDIEAAILDLRGCCAAIRLYSPDTWSKVPEYLKATRKLSQVMTRRCMMENANRAHNDSVERLQLEGETDLIKGLSTRKCSHIVYESRSDTITNTSLFPDGVCAEDDGQTF